ncbi:MAG: hypothetical protein RRB13_02195 [bacterium]|nr:hypothetical protein [bacterium]
MSDFLPHLIRQVQANCDRADARSAQQFTLCTYLLKMREFYRWRQGLGFSATLQKRELNHWIVDHEELWEDLEEQEFEPISIQGKRFDPYDQEALGGLLAAEGFVYNGGLGAKSWPHFFLAELEREETIDGVACLVAGKELARGMVAPPAFKQGERIYLRRDTLRFWVHAKVEEWQFKKRDNPMARALLGFNLESALDESVENLTERILPWVLRHELGEVEMGRRLGPAWGEMLSDLGRSPTELVARTARDLAADSLCVLPQLIESGDNVALHWYFGNHQGMPTTLWPGLQAAYEEFKLKGELQGLANEAASGAQRWPQLCQKILASHQSQDPWKEPELAAALKLSLP